MLFHQGTQTIETERLILRPFSHADNDDMLTYWVSDPKIQSLYSEPTYNTTEEVRRLLENILARMKDPITTVGQLPKKSLTSVLGRLLYFWWTTKIIFAK